MYCLSILEAGIKALAELVPLRAMSKRVFFCFSYWKSLPPWLVDITWLWPLSLDRFLLLFTFNYVYEYVSGRILHMSTVPRRWEEDMESPLLPPNGIMGSCDLPDLGTGNQTWAFWKSSRLSWLPSTSPVRSSGFDEDRMSVILDLGPPNDIILANYVCEVWCPIMVTFMF